MFFFFISSLLSALSDCETEDNQLIKELEWDYLIIRAVRFG